jgi:hypothetical protein
MNSMIVINLLILITNQKIEINKDLIRNNNQNNLKLITKTKFSLKWVRVKIQSIYKKIYLKGQNKFPNHTHRQIDNKEELVFYKWEIWLIWLTLIKKN